jgi:hypothetical protein
VFTRIVNDLLHRHGTSGDLPPVGDEGTVLLERYNRLLKSQLRCRLAKKTSPVQYVRTIRPTSPLGQEHDGNQVLLTMRR